MTGDTKRQEIVAEDTRDSGSGGTAPDPTGSGTTPGRPDRRLSPPMLVALALGLVLIVGAAVAGLVLGPQPSAPAPARAAEPTVNANGPLLLVPVDAPQAGSAGCTALLHNLPATLSDGSASLHARPLAKPAPVAAAAWGGTTGDPVVLRCGIERPPELTPTSPVVDIDGVKWFQISADGASTWYAVDRSATVALTLPGNVSGTGPIQDVSQAIIAAMPQVPVF